MQWHEVQRWAETALNSAREKNDGDLDVVQTAMARGRIQTLKELLALNDTKDVITSQAKFVQPQGLINSVDW
jgi:hypothetical protein